MMFFDFRTTTESPYPPGASESSHLDYYRPVDQGAKIKALGYAAPSRPPIPKHHHRRLGGRASQLHPATAPPPLASVGRVHADSVFNVSITLPGVRCQIARLIRPPAGVPAATTVVQWRRTARTQAIAVDRCHLGKVRLTHSRRRCGSRCRLRRAVIGRRPCPGRTPVARPPPRQVFGATTFPSSWARASRRTPAVPR